MSGIVKNTPFLISIFKGKCKEGCFLSPPWKRTNIITNEFNILFYKLPNFYFECVVQYQFPPKVLKHFFAVFEKNWPPHYCSTVLFRSIFFRSKRAWLNTLKQGFSNFYLSILFLISKIKSIKLLNFIFIRMKINFHFILNL